MTTFFPFSPSRIQAPSYSMRFDGALYRVVIIWNLFGQRFYARCYDEFGVIIFNVAIVQSLPSQAINALSWDVAQLLVTVTTALPHGFKLGTVVQLTIAGAIPEGYNGEVRASITGANTFTYPLAVDPGTIVQFGEMSYSISLTAGYFKSTLVYRSGQFEVSP